MDHSIAGYSKFVALTGIAISGRFDRVVLPGSRKETDRGPPARRRWRPKSMSTSGMPVARSRDSEKSFTQANCRGA